MSIKIPNSRVKMTQDFTSIFFPRQNEGEVNGGWPQWMVSHWNEETRDQKTPYILQNNMNFFENMQSIHFAKA